MTATNKKVWLTRDPTFYRMLGALALPISLQNLITFAVGFADNLMVSRLGDAAVSGVFMGNQLQTFLQLLMTGVVQTTGILAAQYWGKRDMTSIKQIVSLSMRAGLALGLITMLAALLFPTQLIGLLTTEADVIAEGAAYLSIVAWSFGFYAVSQTIVAAMRSVENARVGMYISLVTLVVNIGLNYVLIFGKLGLPAMGIRGAAIATLIARVIECAAAVAYARFVDTKMNLRLSDFFCGVNRLLAGDFLL